MHPNHLLNNTQFQIYIFTLKQSVSKDGSPALFCWVLWRDEEGRGGGQKTGQDVEGEVEGLEGSGQDPSKSLV